MSSQPRILYTRDRRWWSESRIVFLVNVNRYRRNNANVGIRNGMTTDRESVAGIKWSQSARGPDRRGTRTFSFLAVLVSWCYCCCYCCCERDEKSPTSFPRLVLHVFSDARPIGVPRHDTTRREAKRRASGRQLTRADACINGKSRPLTATLTAFSVPKNRACADRSECKSRTRLKRTEKNGPPNRVFEWSTFALRKIAIGIVAVQRRRYDGQDDAPWTFAYGLWSAESRGKGQRALHSHDGRSRCSFAIHRLAGASAYIRSLAIRSLNLFSEHDLYVRCEVKGSRFTTPRHDVPFAAGPQF